MAKVFEGKYQGSLLETYGSVATNNGSTIFTQTDKGSVIRCNGTSQWISYNGSRSVKSVVVFLKAYTLSKDIIDLDGGTHSIEVGAVNVTATGFNAPSIYLDTVATPALPVGLWKCLIVTTATSFTCNALKVGKETSFFWGDVAYIALHDTVLTTSEINDYQKMFNNLKPLAKNKYNVNPYIKPTDLSQYKGSGAGQGLVVAYNMVPVAGILPDISGNGYNMNRTGTPLQTLNGVKFNSNGGYNIASTFNLRQDWTVCVRANFPDECGGGAAYLWDPLFGCGSSYTNGFVLSPGRFLTYDGSGRIVSFTALALFKGLSSTYTVVHTIADKTCKAYFNGAYVGQVTYVNDLVNNVGTFNIDANAGTFGNEEIVDARLYNRVLSLQEIKDYHNQFAKQIYLREHFEDALADGTNVLPRGWIKGTGSYKIIELTANDPVLKHLVKGTKMLQCTVAGTIAIPSNWAYGAVEFDWYKGGEVNQPYIRVISDIIAPIYTPGNNYNIGLYSDESIYFNRIDATIIRTVISYFTNFTWYRTRITRTKAGVFTLRIKGGAFVPTAGYDGWTLVSVAGGSGTNPVSDSTYTTSNFLVLDLDAGDRFGNLDFYPEIKQ